MENIPACEDNFFLLLNKSPTFYGTPKSINVLQYHLWLSWSTPNQSMA